jgi:UDP-3-O-[3-hydroxymyristoyl] glucosamine N-acyltransferase
MRITLEEVARHVGGRVVGDGSIVLSGVAGIKEARPGQLTFLSNPKYERFLATTRASAVVVSPEHSGAGPDATPLLVAENPYVAFAQAVELFSGTTIAPPAGVHPAAVVAPSAILGTEVSIGPHAVVMDGARIGDRSVLHPGVCIGRDVVVGSDTVIHPNVSVAASSAVGDRVIIHAGTVIGSDGFGFAREEEGHRKVPQIGNVVIEDDVEIGANVCIDRATVGTTRIGRGTKIDNLVQIGHNVVVGEGALIVAQVGISGSTEVGRGVVLAGQAGIAGHIEIGDGAMVGAQSGVTKSVLPGERVSGYPAQRHSVSKRILACMRELPSLFRRVRDLERRIVRIESEGECQGPAKGR